MVNIPKESSIADETSSTDHDKPKDTWSLRVDGASNHKGAGASDVIITLNGTLLDQAITLGFLALNNEAKYKALLISLRSTKEPSIKRLAIYLDS